MPPWNPQKPLQGIIMCCTDIDAERRQTLACMVTEMGGQHRYDLTADVSHLVVGSVITPKYAYVAKERPDVQVLLETWIEAARLLWLEGNEGTEEDYASVQTMHKVPALWCLQICLTGFEDVNKREEIKSTVESGGATYHPDLTKKVTHLITATATGKKYEFARRWGVRCVTEQWMSDSLERGMVLDETLYDPTLPPGDQGIGAWRRDLVGSFGSVGNKRSRDESADTNGDGEGRRRMRRTMSKKLTGNAETLWADIATSGPAAAPAQHAFTVTNHEDPLTDARASVRANTIKEAQDQQQDAPQPPSGIFSGASIFIKGFPTQRHRVLEDHLSKNGAIIAKHITDDEDQILLIPHNLPESAWPPMPEVVRKLPKVTEFWVESCIHHKAIVDPVKDRFSQPFKHVRVDGAKGMVIACTGLKDMNLLHFNKTVQMIGAKHDEYLHTTTNLLVCDLKETASDKLKFAWENNIPVVTLNWLWASIEAGRTQPIEAFLVRAPPKSLPNRSRTNSAQPGANQQQAQPAPAVPNRKTAGLSKLGGKLEAVQAEREGRAPRALKELSPAKLNQPSPSPPKQARQPDGKGKTRGPFVHDDEDDSCEMVDKDDSFVMVDTTDLTLPPQETSPLSPPDEEILAHPPGASGLEATGTTTNDALDPSVAPLARADSTLKTRAAELNNSIAALLAARQGSASRRASDAETQHIQPLPRRKRALGRAQSGNSVTSSALSNPTHEATNHPLHPTLDEESQTFSQRFAMQLDGADDEPRTSGVTIPPPPASQGLVYGGDEESRERKEMLLRKLKGEDVDLGAGRKKRAEERVRDVVPMGGQGGIDGIGARVGRKGRRG